MRTNTLLQETKNAFCMKKLFKWVEMGALLPFITFQKCADLRDQPEESKSHYNKFTACADVTSVLTALQCETNVTIRKCNDLWVRFDLHKDATSDKALQVNLHTYPNRSFSKSFQTVANGFTLQTTMPSETTVNDHIIPTKYRHRWIKTIVNPEGDWLENVLNCFYSHSSHLPHTKLHHDMQKHLATISTRVLANISNCMFLMPAIHRS